MKARPTILLLIVSAVLAALLLVQWRQLKDQKQLTQTLQLQVEKMQGEIQSSERLQAEFQTEKAELEERVRTLQLQAASPRQDLAVPAEVAASGANSGQTEERGQPRSSRNSNPLNMVAEMMKDPETRKVMEQQQRMAVDMMYSGLYEKLGLNDEQKEKLKDILLKQQMSAIEQSTSMLDQENADKEQITEQIMADKAERDEQIKDLLGEEGFQQLEDYTLTMGERMMMGQQMKLPPQQFDQLLDIIAEEKRAAQAMQMPGADPNQNPTAILQEGFMDQFLASQETINTMVYERARAMLTPDQLQNLAEFQNNQLTLQRAQIEMARKMMQPDAGLAPAPMEAPPTAVP